MVEIVNWTRRRLMFKNQGDYKTARWWTSTVKVLWTPSAISTIDLICRSDPASNVDPSWSTAQSSTETHHHQCRRTSQAFNVCTAFTYGN